MFHSNYQSTKLPRLQGGFSLLELLLVISLIAVISLMGITMHRQRTINIKVEKTALQIQQWLQASLAYYNDFQNWPTNSSDLLPSASSHNNYYISAAVKTNPWGFDYKVEPINEDKLIRVSVAVPRYSQQSPRALAKRIAARLPNASFKGTDEQPIVEAEVNVPGQNRDRNNNFRILRILKVDIDGKRGIYPSITEPTEKECPRKNNHPEVYYSLSSFVVNDPNDPRSSKRAVSTESVNSGHREKLSKWNPDVKIQPFRREALHHGSIVAIVTCEPNATQVTAGGLAANNDPDYLF